MLVVEVARIVEVLRARGALLHARAALDADATHLLRVRRVDRAHRAQPRAQAAAGAAGEVGFAPYLEDIDVVPGAVTRGVVGADRLFSAHGNRLRRGSRERAHLLREGAGKIVHLRYVRRVGTARAECAGKRVLPDEGRAAHDGKAVRAENIPQLDERIVKVPVAEGDHRHGQRPVEGGGLSFLLPDSVFQIQKALLSFFLLNFTDSILF